MKHQLPLDLTQPVRYLGRNFVRHHGVSELLATFESFLAARNTALLHVVAEAGFGKTHLAVHLAVSARSAGKKTVFVDGSDLREWCVAHRNDSDIPHNGVVVVDDIQLFLQSLVADDCSGPFVDLIERCRRRRTVAVFTSPGELKTLQCDDHIMSRMRAAVELRINNPSEEDLDSLLLVIAKQHGLFLSESKRSFILKRAERSIPGLTACVRKIAEGRDEISEVAASTSTSFTVLSEALASN